MADRVGQQLGNYRLTRLLGRGGFAEVYLGEHVYLKTPAAIKLLHTKGTSQEGLEGFLREAQAIARLIHPHIVRVLEFGVDGDGETPFLVMDYAPNGSLRQYYPKKTPLPLTTIMPHVRQVASALQYAHNARIIHRDVKPENMLLGRGNKVLLSDFGIALLAHSSNSLSTQEVAGTATYMAPEQFQGKPRLASDQYALGVVIYEWLTGERPFHGSFIELCTQHIFTPPVPLHQKISSIPPAVEHVVLKALAKAPEDRYRSVAEFANELERAAASSHFAAVAELPQTPIPGDRQKSPLHIPRRTVLEQPTFTSTPTSSTIELSLTTIAPETPLKMPAYVPPIPPGPKPPAPQSFAFRQARRWGILFLLLCLIIAAGWGGESWLGAVRQQQLTMATATASASVYATATAAADAYTAATSKGIQFGIDPTHMRWNQYEQIIKASNVSHLTKKWSYSAGNAVASSPTVANEMVYVGSMDHWLYVFDATCRNACTPLWAYSTGGGILSSPAVAGGMVYVGSGDHKVYAFDANCRSACTPLWSYTTGNGVGSSPTVANGMVYVGSDDHNFYAFDATCRKDCTPLWSYPTGDHIFSSAAVANGMVYVGSLDNTLYVFDAKCHSACQPLWTYTTGGSVFSSPTVANGLVYVGSLDHKFYAFDANCRSACKPLWSYSTGGYITASPAVANGFVYVGSLDHGFYAFDANCRSACKPLWSYPTTAYVRSSPTVANGVVYIGSDDHKLYAFSTACRRSCKPLWSYSATGYVEAEPAVANGMVYVGSDAGSFYAFGLP